MTVRNTTMVYYINIGLCVATKIVKNVEVFKENVVNLLTKKAKYWGEINVVGKKSRIQEKLVERMDAEHHAFLQNDKFQIAWMINIYVSYSSEFLVIFINIGFHDMKFSFDIITFPLRILLQWFFFYMCFISISMFISCMFINHWVTLIMKFCLL